MTNVIFIWMVSVWIVQSQSSPRLRWSCSST